MVQELFKIGIIGAGPAGCACAYFIKKLSPACEVFLFDYGEPMRTIIPTGGGKCNLANAEYDFKELVKSYPRGEKFLYSVFSQFSTADTIDFFDELGVKTYVREDNRIFPVSNNSVEIKDKLLDKLHNCKFIKEKVLRLENTSDEIRVVTDMNSYKFDKIVYSVGGKNGYDIIKRLGINIIEPKPSLVGLVTEQKFSDVAGIVIKEVYNSETGLKGDILCTHYGISGPLVYKISSLKARDIIPYKLSFKLCNMPESFQEVLNLNSHKLIKNILSEYLPQNFCIHLLSELEIEHDLKGHKIDGKTRDKIINKINNYEIIIKSTRKDGETVTCGGIDLNSINSKTMSSKDITNLYFCGEVIDVDGFCGGYNLQNCWSTAYVAAKGIVV